jgi:hypothetical protein
MASARQRGGRWIGLYRDAGGKQKSAGTYDTEREAVARAQVAELDAHPPKPVKVYPAEKKSQPTLAGYGPLAIAGARLEATSRETYSCLFKHVEREFGSLAVADLTPAEVRAFARKLESSGMSSSTAHHVFGVLKLIVRTAVQDGFQAEGRPSWRWVPLPVRRAQPGSRLASSRARPDDPEQPARPRSRAGLGLRLRQRIQRR